MEVGEYLPREALLRARRQLVSLTIFGVLVLLIMALYGWILYRSLADREARELVFQARVEARRLAEYIEGEVRARPDEELLMATTTGSTRTLIDFGLAAQPAVAAVTVRDELGAVILADRWSLASGRTVDDLAEAAGHVIEEPIGSLGSLVVALDPAERDRRIQDLRSVILGRVTSMLVPVLVLFAVGVVVLWRTTVASRQQLERANHTERMAYIGTLAAGLAHEIRSPLNSLSLNMQMLDEEVARVEPEGSARRLLEITRAEIERLERLVTEFLNYARPRPIEAEHVKARDLIDRVVAVVGGGLESRGVEVRIEDSSNGAMIRADPAQMHQLLLNLTENAAQATEHRRPAWVEYVLSADEDTVRIRIHDNGRGMLPEDVEKATEIFFSRRKGGTGLGLAIVDRIVKSHNGRIRLESELQVGTTVTVELPRAHGAAT